MAFAAVNTRSWSPVFHIAFLLARIKRQRVLTYRHSHTHNLRKSHHTHEMEEQHRQSIHVIETVLLNGTVVKPDNNDDNKRRRICASRSSSISNSDANEEALAVARKRAKSRGNSARTRELTDNKTSLSPSRPSGNKRHEDIKQRKYHVVPSRIQQQHVKSQRQLTSRVGKIPRRPRCGVERRPPPAINVSDLKQAIFGVAVDNTSERGTRNDETPNRLYISGWPAPRNDLVRHHMHKVLRASGYEPVTLLFPNVTQSFCFASFDTAKHAERVYDYLRDQWHGKFTVEHARLGRDTYNDEARCASRRKHREEFGRRYNEGRRTTEKNNKNNSSKHNRSGSSNSGSELDTRKRYRRRSTTTTPPPPPSPPPRFYRDQLTRGGSTDSSIWTIND